MSSFNSFNYKQTAQLVDAFVYFDQNNDGFLTPNEFNRAITFLKLGYVTESEDERDDKASQNIYKISLLQYLRFLLIENDFDFKFRIQLSETGEEDENEAKRNNLCNICSYLGERFSDEEVDDLIDDCSM